MLLKYLSVSPSVIPQLGLCLGAVSLWQQCSGQGSMYCCSADIFLATLSKIYSDDVDDTGTTRVLPPEPDCPELCVRRNTHACGSAVFLYMTERILDQRLPRRGSSRDGLMVTLFQLWNYLDSNKISDVDTHVTELAKEGTYTHRRTCRNIHKHTNTLTHTRTHPNNHTKIQTHTYKGTFTLTQKYTHIIVHRHKNTHI